MSVADSVRTDVANACLLRSPLKRLPDVGAPQRALGRVENSGKIVRGNDGHLPFTCHYDCLALLKTVARLCVGGCDLGRRTESGGGRDHGGSQRQPPKPSPERAIAGSGAGLTNPCLLCPCAPR